VLTADEAHQIVDALLGGHDAEEEFAYHAGR
jgi:hypothetical protein